MTGAFSRAQAARLLRFLIVGGSFSLGYSLATALLVAAGAPPYATAVILYLACIPAAYLVQKRFTFRVTQVPAGSFAIYAATQLAGLALVASVTTRFVTQIVAIDTMIFLATGGIAAVLSFTVNAAFAFRPRG